MYKYFSIFALIFLTFAVGCKDNSAPGTKGKDNEIQVPTSLKKALLVIDNYTTDSRTITDNTKDGEPIELIKLEPFEIKEVEIALGEHTLEVTPADGMKSSTLTKNIDSEAIFVWDLASTNTYETLLLSNDGIGKDKTYKEDPDGFYKTSANVSCLSPLGQQDHSVYRLFKDMPNDTPLTVDYAKKIINELPFAFTMETINRAVTTIAGDLEGAKLEVELYPLFQKQYPAIYIPAADLLAKRGSKEFGGMILNQVIENWQVKQDNLKRMKAIHIIAGCLGVDGLKTLWDAADIESRGFIFNALTQSNLDESVEFFKLALQVEDSKYKQIAFRYLILVDFIYKPGVYEIVRDFARMVDREDPEAQLLKVVVTNASSVLNKFDDEMQIEVLLDNLRFPDANMMRFGLQKIVKEHEDEGLKALTSEYLSLPEQIRVEAVNQVIYKYHVKPRNENLVNFLKLVIEEDSISTRYAAVVVLAKPIMLDFDPSLHKFLNDIVNTEPRETKGKISAVVDKGYAEYLIAKEYTKDVEINLKKLVKSGGVDAAIIAFNYLKLKLEEKGFAEFLNTLKTDFNKYSASNKCVLVDKFSREFSETDAKDFLLKTLKDEHSSVRTVAFDRLILNPKYTQDEVVMAALNEALANEKHEGTKQYFSRTIQLTKINSGIMSEITPDILAAIDAALGSDDEVLVQKTLQLVQGFEEKAFQQLLVKHFATLPEKQRVHVADFMPLYKDVDFEWVEKAVTDESPAVRQALFFALLSRLKTMKDERARNICEKLIENEPAKPLKERYQKSLDEIN